MKSMLEEKMIDAMMPLDKLVDARFVDQYLGNNGWYDVTTEQGRQLSCGTFSNGEGIQSCPRLSATVGYPTVAIHSANAVSRVLVASTSSCRNATKSWMAGTSPAMTLSDAMTAPKLSVENIHKTFFKPVKNDVIGSPCSRRRKPLRARRAISSR